MQLIKILQPITVMMNTLWLGLGTFVFFLFVQSDWNGSSLGLVL
jgi:hypothetical protein